MGKLPVRSLLIIVLKSGKIIKLFKSLKFLKAGASFVSMSVFAACYSTMMGITLAIAFTLLILTHELGHVVALKVKGYPVKLPLFIPFLGAVIFAPKIKSRHTEAYIGIGGPFIGTLASMLVMVPYYYTGQKIWLVAAFLGVLLNLFNMIPISPLDGGRITQAVHRNFKWVGIAMLLAVTLAGGEPGMLIIWMAVVMDLDKLSMFSRSKFMVLIWVLMATLTFLGVGENFIHNLGDVVLGVILLVPAVVIIYDKGLRKAWEEEESNQQQEKRTECTPLQRKQWAWSWAGLIVLQIGLMLLLAPAIEPPKPSGKVNKEQVGFLFYSYSNTFVVITNAP